jgi:hypothetical protein
MIIGDKILVIPSTLSTLGTTSNASKMVDINTTSQHNPTTWYVPTDKV